MATNAIVLLTVVAIAAVVMAGALGWVVIKTRTPKSSTAVRDPAVDEDTLALERQQFLADQFVADARSGQVATSAELIIGGDASGNATPSSAR